MANLWEILQREDGCASLPRCCALFSFLMCCIFMIAELFGFEAKHLPDFMLFSSGLFGWCAGSKYLDIKKDKAGEKV